ncbi:MAG: phage tail sheath subtilisin-like domain-containing protein [Bradymonadales bacterium]
MAKIRVPGIYFEDNPKISRDITVGETGVPAFLGVSERGPLNEPVSIQSVQQFRRIFGDPVEDSYLYPSVWGFFANGGTRCFVVRIAHVFRHGDGELARAARYELLDSQGYPTLEVLASSEGTWGNDVSVEVEEMQEARVHSFLSFDLTPGVRMATLQSARGIDRGMVLKFDDGDVTSYVTVERVRGNEIYWREDLEHHYKSASPTYVQSVEFTLAIKDKKRSERFANLSMSKFAVRNVCRVIQQESGLIRINMLSSGEHSSFPMVGQNITLRGGRDGIAGITPDDVIGYNNGPGARYGLGALEANEEIDLVAIPDLQYLHEHIPVFDSTRDLLGIQLALINHCERMGDRFAILDTPRGIRADQVQDYRSKFNSSFGALYYPWIQARIEASSVLIPPSGYIAGLMARCDRTDGVFRAPANVELKNCTDVEVKLSEGHLAELNDKGINCIRSIPQRGIRPWGARSLSTDPDWRYLTSRRVFNAVKRAIYENTQWVVFEVNGSELRDQVRIMLDDFLARLWAAGYFAGQEQAHAFFVQCDEENNDIEVVESGNFVVDVGICIGKPMEFITMSFEHKMEEQVIGV